MVTASVRTNQQGYDISGLDDGLGSFSVDTLALGSIKNKQLPKLYFYGDSTVSELVVKVNKLGFIGSYLLNRAGKAGNSGVKIYTDIKSKYYVVCHNMVYYVSGGAVAHYSLSEVEGNFSMELDEFDFLKEVAYLISKRKPLKNTLVRLGYQQEHIDRILSKNIDTTVGTEGIELILNELTEVLQLVDDYTTDKIKLVKLCVTDMCTMSVKYSFIDLIKYVYTMTDDEVRGKITEVLEYHKSRES